jgi:UDP-glucose 4-epimerase
MITGGAGYIGSIIVEELLRAGHEAIVFDSLERGHVEAVPAAATLIAGKVQDRELVTATLRRFAIEAVIHMAAYLEVGESVKFPERFFANNVAGSLEVLHAMLDANVGKIVFSSTAALYGDPQRVPILEEDAAAPTNPYGQSKLIVEEMLKWVAQVHGLTATSLRYFNAAGASEMNGEDHDPETHLIPIVLRSLLQDQPVAVNGTDYPTKDGTCVRDFVHVRDLAQAHILALGRVAPGLSVYNLGIGEGFSVREVLDTAMQVTGLRLRINEGPRRAGDQAVTIASSEKIRRELGWDPQYTALDAIIGSAWEWKKRHPNGYAR